MRPTEVLITIVVPCWNHGRLLSRCVESVLAQTGSPFELLVVDDGSTDSTREVVASYGEQVRYISQPNQGLSSARNTGLHHAAGEWVLFLDADDALGPDTLDAYRQSIENHDADIYYGTYQNLSDDGTLLNQVFPNVLLADDPFHQLLSGNSMAVHSVLARRTVLLEECGFDTSLKSHEDWHLWLRLAFRGCRFQPVPDAMAFYYRGSLESMSRNYGRMLSTGLEVLDRFENVHPGCSRCANAIDAGQRNLRANCYGAILLPSLLHQLRSGHVWRALCLIYRHLRADTQLGGVMLSHLGGYLSRMILGRFRVYRS